MEKMNDMFEQELANAQADLTKESIHHGIEKKAKAISRKIEKITLRRAKTEAVLFEILPAKLEIGMSYHVISHGDVDALSYLIHIVRQTPVEKILVSTWCMAMPDVEWFQQKLEEGRIGQVNFVLGEIFPSQYPDEYEAIKKLQKFGYATLRIARNHAKVMAGESPDGEIHFAIESSGNINTNPRIEQTAIHMDKGLHDHYVDFFADIKSIDGEKYKKAKPCQA